MIKQLLVIGLGGALGSILRYLAQMLTNHSLALVFPLDTFSVNITGCFLIGIFYGVFEKYSGLNYDWRLFLITGLCGGYTTFSSFSYESITLFRQGDYVYFSLYAGLSVLLGLFATVGGTAIIK